MIIETSVEVMNIRDEELLGRENIMYVDMAIDLNEVCTIREVINDNDTEVNNQRCMVYLKSGESFNIFISYKEVLKKFKQIKRL
jgi:hypothetical protein